MMYKQTRDDNEGRGLQALFPVGMNLLIKQDDVETDTDDNEGEDYRHSFQ